MSETLSGLECRYQEKVTNSDVAEALSAAQCRDCGVTVPELMERGEILEVCGEVYASDIATGERVLTSIPLCPDCHRRHHLDAKRQHRPCQIEATLSREGLD